MNNQIILQSFEHHCLFRQQAQTDLTERNSTLAINSAPLPRLLCCASRLFLVRHIYNLLINIHNVKPMQPWSCEYHVISNCITCGSLVYTVAVQRHVVSRCTGQTLLPTRSRVVQLAKRATTTTLRTKMETERRPGRYLSCGRAQISIISHQQCKKQKNTTE